MKESGAVIIGGHSIIDEEIKYGMAVTGVIHPDKIFRNVGVQEGDALVLTKALGTGIISTALKKGKASKESVDAAVQSMITLNAVASKVARKFPVHACSDVTGFGILGHALGMASGSSVTLVIESAKLPLLHRAARLAEKGYITGGCKRNREYLQDKITIEKSIREGLVEVAIDPQTSGGLLIAVGKSSRQTRGRTPRRRRQGRHRSRLRHLSTKTLGPVGLSPVSFLLSLEYLLLTDTLSPYSTSARPDGGGFAANIFPCCGIDFSCSAVCHRPPESFFFSHR